MGGSADDLVGFRLCHEQVGYKGTNKGTHGYAMDPFIIGILEEEIDISRQNCSNVLIYFMDMEVLLCSCESFGIFVWWWRWKGLLAQMWRGPSHHRMEPTPLPPTWCTWCGLQSVGCLKPVARCVPHLMVQSVVSVILVSITFSLRPDEAILLVMAKACLILQNILFCISFKEFT